MACNVDWPVIPSSPKSNFDGETWKIDDDDAYDNDNQHHSNISEFPDDNWEILEDDYATNATHENSTRTEICVDLPQPNDPLEDYAIINSSVHKLPVDQSSTENTELADTSVEETSLLRRNRSGSISSPDFRKLVFEDDGFTIVSNPGTVLSCWSSSTSDTINPVRTFRDILMTKPKESKVEGSLEPIPSSNHRPILATNNRRMKKSQFVVVRTSNLKRCAKSSNDLSVIDEQEHYDDDRYDDHGVEFYYSNKAMGARGRNNGLKLRPDELKRKDIILHKKNLQRQSSGV
jgi:hypothetical protein